MNNINLHLHWRYPGTQRFSCWHERAWVKEAGEEVKPYTREHLGAQVRSFECVDPMQSCYSLVSELKSDLETSITASDWISAFEGPIHPEILLYFASSPHACLWARKDLDSRVQWMDKQKPTKGSIRWLHVNQKLTTTVLLSDLHL